MLDRQRNRFRFFNMRNATIGGGILTFIGKIVYDDLKNDDGIIRSTYRKMIGSKHRTCSVVDNRMPIREINPDKK